MAINFLLNYFRVALPWLSVRRRRSGMAIDFSLIENDSRDAFY